MPPRYAYWTILVDEQPTAFRSGSKEDLLPTFNRLKEKSPTAVMMWFQNGKLWPSRLDAQEAMRARGEMGRRGDTRQAGGFRERHNVGARSDRKPEWKPRGEAERTFRPKPQAPSPKSSEKLDWKPKGEFTPAPKRADRAERSDRAEWKPKSSRPQDPKSSWKPKGSFTRDAKPEWKAKSFDRDRKPEWKSKSFGSEKPEWKPKGAGADRDRKPRSFARPEWKPSGDDSRSSKPEWKPKGSFDRKPEWKAKSFDGDRKPDWKPKGSFDGERKSQWRPKTQDSRPRTARSEKPEWKPKGSFDRKSEWKPRTEKPQWTPKTQDSGPKTSEKRKWVPKEEYKKSLGIEAKRDAKWRPGGTHQDPRQKYKDAKKAKWTKFKKTIRTKWESKSKKKS